MSRGIITEYVIPASLKEEHEELHAELAEAVKAGGKTGAAAENVARALHPHFVKEEEYALPPLGLLTAIAGGKITEDMGSVVIISDRLKAELPRMLKEHRDIVGTLEILSEEAKKEGKAGPVRFAEKLALHARTEEEVLYPAAILVGEYVRLKLGK